MYSILTQIQHSAVYPYIKLIIKQIFRAEKSQLWLSFGAALQPNSKHEEWGPSTRSIDCLIDVVQYRLQGILGLFAPVQFQK